MTAKSTEQAPVVEAEDEAAVAVEPSLAENAGFVIEHGDSQAAGPLYYTGTGWDVDHLMAVRFCREQDADAVVAGLPALMTGSTHRVCLHIWG